MKRARQYACGRWFLKILHLPAVLFFILTAGQIFTPAAGRAQELPESTPENAFYIMPLFEAVRTNQLTYEAKEAEFARMKEELGEGNLYHRLGFSFIYPPQNDAIVREVCALAQKYRVHLGLIFALQSHTRNDLRNVAENDFRMYQWRIDGEDWKGAFTNSGSLEIPEDQRDYKVPTPSRYAAPLREYNAEKAREWGEAAVRLMNDFPGVITCINGPIEEELAVGGHNDNTKLADYSPYAITEFRDWLRHSGMYDATSGAFAGEGAGSHIIGELIDFNGTLRSPFYDDPSPADNNGTGESFNDYFGTNFGSWHLRYWDLDIYPEPITDEDFDPTPESGEGFHDGGFDAPRGLNANSRFWRAWSYDIPDQNGEYPAGNPENPAFGFRQHMVRNYIRDLMDTVASTGIPRELMYAHQIPGEALGNFTGAGGRNRSSASTVWTGYMEKSENVGITRFGPIDPELMTQYAEDWGIFEWHTKPFSERHSTELYDASEDALNSYYSNQCHYLFPGWWLHNEGIFPLDNSSFAEAIHDFMNARKEVPYHLQGAEKDYTPPRVTGVQGSVDDPGVLSVQWQKRIWKDLLPWWTDWDHFSHFEVQWRSDGGSWSQDTSETAGFSVSVEEDAYEVQVRCISSTGLAGEWSEIVTAGEPVQTGTLRVVPEFDTLYADPGMANKITISLDSTDQVIAPGSLTVSLRGDGATVNTQPAGVESVEKYWPMDSPDEINSVYRLDNVLFSGGVMAASVSEIEPVDPYFYFTGSSINSSEITHVTFRMYASSSSSGHIYWFYEGGLGSYGFEIREGWNIYRFSGLPDWDAHSTIQKVRLDPGTSIPLDIQLDWFALSSAPLSDQYEMAVNYRGGGAELLTFPTSDAGSYTVTSHWEELSDSAVVTTAATNEPPAIEWIHPQKDTLVEQGSPLWLEASATDGDGKITGVTFYRGDVALATIPAPPFRYAWIPQTSGSFELKASAVDNALETISGQPKTVEVVQQEGYPEGIHAVPGILEAEDYDTGGKLIAFFDSDAGNQGAAYRSDDVDIEAFEQGDGYYISHTQPGEWTEYSLDVSAGMLVDIAVWAASETEVGEIHLEINDQQVTNHLLAGATGGKEQFEAVFFRDVYLHAGAQKLKLFIDEGGMNIDKIEISKHPTTGNRTVAAPASRFLYPNPANKEVFIDADPAHRYHFKMVSMNGQVVKNRVLLPGEDRRVSVAGLPPGIYLVVLVSDAGVLKEKLIKY